MEEQKLNRGRTWGAVLQVGERVLDAFFHPDTDRVSRLVSVLWTAGLLVYGIYLWGVFFSWGNISFDFLDWAEVIGPRYGLLRDAAEKGLLPLHVSNTTALRGATDRYLAIADTPFSPQFFFMRFMDLGTFAFYNHIFLYLIGFAGLLWIGWKYRLSPAAFTVLFLIFNMNGHLVSHIAVGHLNWSGHFLLPYFVLAMLALMERRHGWKWLLGLSVVMLLILLQGGFHLYIWCLLYLGLLGIFFPRLWKPVLLGGLFSGLVGAFRLLPPVTVLSIMDPELFNGFPSLADLVSGLIILREPQQSFNFRTLVNALSWWELDFYIGLLGLAFLLWFGVFLPLRNRRAAEPGTEHGFGRLLLPALALSVLSLGEIYHAVVTRIPIPLLAGERVTSRFLIVPLVIVLVLAAIFFQRTLDGRKGTTLERALLLVGLFLLHHDLMQHMKLWRIRYLDSLDYVFSKLPINLRDFTVANHPDPVYSNLIAAGLAISIMALAFLVVMSARRRA